MWDVKRAINVNRNGSTEFYLNYVGCKGENERRQVPVRVFVLSELCGM